jgi:hypothetical protein
MCIMLCVAYLDAVGVSLHEGDDVTLPAHRVGVEARVVVGPEAVVLVVPGTGRNNGGESEGGEGSEGRV